MNVSVKMNLRENVFLIAKKSTTHKRVPKPMGFNVESSGDCQNLQFWCTTNFGTRLGGSLAPKRVSKPMVFKTASYRDFQNSLFSCTSNFGTRLGVSENSLRMDLCDKNLLAIANATTWCTQVSPLQRPSSKLSKNHDPDESSNVTNSELESLIVTSPALILSRNSGISLAKNLRKVLDRLEVLGHILRAIWYVQPKCSYSLRWVSLKEYL